MEVVTTGMDEPKSRFTWAIIAAVLIGISIFIGLHNLNKKSAEEPLPPITSQYASLKYVCHATQQQVEGTFGWQPWDQWVVMNSTIRPQGYYKSAGGWSTGYPTVKGMYLEKGCLGPFSNSSEACPALQNANILNLLGVDDLRDLGCSK